MKIEKRIIIMLAVSLVIVIAFGASLLYSFQQDRKAIAAHDKAEGIYRKVFQLNALTYDYLMHPTERAREQWQQLSGDLEALITAPVFATEEQPSILGRIVKSHRDINNDFSRIVTIHDKHGTMEQGKHDVYYDMEMSLARHLLIEMQTIIEQSRRLGRIGNESLQRVQQTTTLIQAVFFMLLFSMLVTNFYWQRKGIIQPVRKLMNGVEIIGSGNLDYKIGITTEDEIGEFSTAFDRMTGNLKSITVSRDEYQQLVDNPFVGVYKFNRKGDILFANEALARIYEFESPEGLMSVSALAIYKNPEDRKKLLEALRTTGKVENFESEMITHTGKVKNILFNATLEGEVLSGMVLDITGRKQAEAALSKTKDDLERSNKELERKLHEIKTLRGILPICSYCKKIRDDKGSWEQMEMYIREHSEAEFSHGMCPACEEKAFKEFESFKKKNLESRSQESE